LYRARYSGGVLVGDVQIGRVHIGGDRPDAIL